MIVICIHDRSRDSDQLFHLEHWRSSSAGRLYPVAMMLVSPESIGHQGRELSTKMCDGYQVGAVVYKHIYRPWIQGTHRKQRAIS